MLVFVFYFQCFSLLFSILLNLFKSPSFLPFSSNPLLKILPNGEYSNLACSTKPDLYPKSSPVKYSYLSNSLG